MKFSKVDLQLLLGEIADLPSDWMDEDAQVVVGEIPIVVDAIRAAGSRLDFESLRVILSRHRRALDVLRLIAGEGQEPMAHRVSGALGDKHRDWSFLRRLATRDPEQMAAALVRIGLPDIVAEQVSRTWTINDVLLDRYRLGRGRAIAGQKRGRSLENDVEKILQGIPVPFEPRVTFTSRGGKTAKCDFAIPTRNEPLIVIEAKGYEATGSKLTDFLGDVLKIEQAKDYHTYFFVVTDGRGWFNRESDLRRLVRLHHEGTIEMVYTRARLADLAKDVKQVWTTEQ